MRLRIDCLDSFGVIKPRDNASHLTKDFLVILTSSVSCMSLGLITPKESRQSVLSLMEALLFYHLKENKEPTYADLQEYLKEQKVEVNEKTLRYHLTNLRKAGVLEDARGVYRFTGFNGNNLSAALEESYKRRADLAFSNIKSAVDLLQKMHSE